MKPLYEKVTEAMEQFLQQEQRDAELIRQLRDACRVTKDGTWNVNGNAIELPDGKVCSFGAKDGTITVCAPDGATLGEFDDVDKASVCVAQALARAIMKFERDEDARLKTANWRKASAKPLPPSAQA
jgi:hypothetical protein